MAFVTYTLLSTLLAGLRGDFHPEVMGLTATAAFAIVLVEILGLKFGTYILSISNESQLLDLVAYSGYKFVGVIVTLVVAEIVNRGAGTGGWAGWAVFLYTYGANAFFLVRTDDRSPLSLPCRILLSLRIDSTASRQSNRYSANNTYTAPLTEIRPPPRLLEPRRRRNADRRALAAQPTDSVPGLLQLHRTACLHVDIDPAGQRECESRRCESLKVCPRGIWDCNR